MLINIFAECKYSYTARQMINGIKICRQAYAKYEERFDETQRPAWKTLLLAYR